jgi:uncharacterized membrane protein YfcA
MSVDNMYISTIEINLYIIYPLCSILIGVDKGGIPGLAALGMTVLVSGHPTGGVNHTVATFVPVLLIADLGAFYAYKDSVDWAIIKLITIPMIIGIFAGVILLEELDDKQVKIAVGLALIILAMFHFTYKYCIKKTFEASTIVIKVDKIRSDSFAIADSPKKRSDSNASTASSDGYKKRRAFLLSICCGFVAGILTMVANVAGPIVTAYFLSLGVQKRELNGTRAFLFLIANLIKVPVQIFLGNLVLSEIYVVVALILVALLATFITERFIISHIDQNTFEALSWSLVIIGALKLLSDFNYYNK